MFTESSTTPTAYIYGKKSQCSYVSQWSKLKTQQIFYSGRSIVFCSVHSRFLHFLQNSCDLVLMHRFVCSFFPICCVKLLGDLFLVPICISLHVFRVIYSLISPQIEFLTMGLLCSLGRILQLSDESPQTDVISGMSQKLEQNQNHNSEPNA